MEVVGPFYYSNLLTNNYSCHLYATFRVSVYLSLQKGANSHRYFDAHCRHSQMIYIYLELYFLEFKIFYKYIMSFCLLS